MNTWESSFDSKFATATRYQRMRVYSDELRWKFLEFDIFISSTDFKRSSNGVYRTQNGINCFIGSSLNFIKLRWLSNRLLTDFQKSPLDSSQVVTLSTKTSVQIYSCVLLLSNISRVSGTWYKYCNLKILDYFSYFLCEWKYGRVRPAY